MTTKNDGKGDGVRSAPARTLFIYHHLDLLAGLTVAPFSQAGKKATLVTSQTHTLSRRRGTRPNAI